MSAAPGRSRPAADVLVDTSAAVALVLDAHEGHDATRRALHGRTLGLAGHAAFETFSVLTRLPPPVRRPPDVVATLLAHDFPATRFLSAAETAQLYTRLPALGIAGGQVHDALVGAVAAHAAIPLATRDRRAAEVYRLLDASVELLA